MVAGQTAWGKWKKTLILYQPVTDNPGLSSRPPSRDPPDEAPVPRRGLMEAGKDCSHGSMSHALLIVMAPSAFSADQQTIRVFAS